MLLTTYTIVAVVSAVIFITLLGVQSDSIKELMILSLKWYITIHIIDWQFTNVCCPKKSMLDSKLVLKRNIID